MPKRTGAKKRARKRAWHNPANLCNGRAGCSARHGRASPSLGDFSDLVGSTALSARMDPEDLREVISAYQRCVAETVGRFGGFVAKYVGDGVWCISGIRRPMNGHNIYHI
jgi:hypothetical protein